jgi:hypothetical protein
MMGGRKGDGEAVASEGKEKSVKVQGCKSERGKPRPTLKKRGRGTRIESGEWRVKSGEKDQEGFLAPKTPLGMTGVCLWDVGQECGKRPQGSKIRPALQVEAIA